MSTDSRDRTKRGDRLGTACIYAFAAVGPFIIAVGSTALSVRSSDRILLIELEVASLWMLILILLFVVDVFTRRWRQFAHRLVSCLFAGLAFMPAAKSGDYVHLALFYPTYAKVIDSHPEQTVFRFEWKSPGDSISGVAGVGPIILVYDGSGSIAGNIGHKRMQDDGNYIVTEYLLGHFFLEKTF